MNDLHTLIKTKQFIGAEFLTWLWYEAEAGNLSCQINCPVSMTSKNFYFWIDDKLTLKSNSHKTHESILKGGEPSQSHEAAVGLKDGKTVNSIKLGIHIETIGDYFVQLNSNDLILRSLQLPLNSSNNSSDYDDESREDSQESHVLKKRLLQINLLLQAFDLLFSTFTKQRLNPEWQTVTLPKVRSWISNRKNENFRVIH